MESAHNQGRLTRKGRLSVPKMPGIDTAGGGFRAGAAGSKRYGTGQVAPTQGKIANKTGYKERDQRLRAQRAVLARRLGK